MGEPSKNKEDYKKGVSVRSRAIARLSSGLFVVPLFFWCVFSAAGDTGWVHGWLYIGIQVAGTTIITILVAAFDAGNGWSTMESPVWWVVGLALFCAYIAILTWSMLVNTHFEKTVRIQTDRNHKVIDTGPYRIVRHPGYLGMIAGFILSAPLLLGSWWAFVPALASTVSMIVRTVLEDRTLREELDGYEDYDRRVRYRLVPGIW